MHIVLCDDEPNQQEIIALLIKKYKETRPNSEIKLSIFSSGDELLSYSEGHGECNLYILDVIMPKLNGIQIGTALRDRNDDGLIIYLTTSPDFAVDSYQSRAFNYILKPVNEEYLFDVLDKAYMQIEVQKAKGITVKVAGGALQLILLNTILYAELTGRSVRYYLRDGENLDSVTFRGSFKNEIEPLLRQEDFILCGSSFVVNLRHVTEVRKVDIVLTNGRLVPISRNMHSTVKKQWLLYWSDRI